MLGEAFDPEGELVIYEHSRPHWSQTGSEVFITFRTQDSIPREVVQRWDREKQDWLRTRGIVGKTHWSHLLPTLTEKDRSDFHLDIQPIS